LDKVIFNGVKINWFGIDKKRMELGFRSIGVQSYPIDEYTYINSFNEENSANLEIDETYLGLRLYDLTIYSICNDLIIFKDELKLDLHRDVIFKWFSIAKTIINDFNNKFKDNDFSLVIVINGHSLMDACLLAFAKKYNLPFLCIENTSNSNRIVWDNISGKVVTYNLAKEYFNKFKNKINKKKAEMYAMQFKKTVFDYKKKEHLSNFNNYQVPFNRPYVLFLAQVYCDAAQLFAIDGEFKNPVQIIESTIDLCHDLNIPLVIKLHPKENKGISPSDKPYGLPTYYRIKKYETENVCIDYNNTYNTFKLIEDSQIVVTVNSQAGLESCLYDKPVLSYYNSFYSGLGFTYDYTNKQSLQNNIEYLINNRVSNNKCLTLSKVFFYIFFERYCIENSNMELFYKALQSGRFTNKTRLKFVQIKVKNSLKKTVKSYLVVFAKYRLMK
jgi:capsule polysaccharide export protein KpsC/LpsZ